MKSLFIGLLIVVCCLTDSQAKQENKEIEGAVIGGLTYLQQAQQANGSWRNCPGTSALVLKAIVHDGVPQGFEETVEKYFSNTK